MTRNDTSCCCNLTKDLSTVGETMDFFLVLYPFTLWKPSYAMTEQYDVICPIYLVVGYGRAARDKIEMPASIATEESRAIA